MARVRMNRLGRKFYARPTVKVAQELLGKLLVHEFKNRIVIGKVVETEAYLGSEDPGSHAFKGPTKRSKIMFGKPGHAYVYFAYGNHWMLNVVTEKTGKPGAVLIRAVEPLAGIEIMKRRRKAKDLKKLTNGPAKVTQAFGITGRHNGVDLTKGNLYFAKGEEQRFSIIKAKRIGLSKGEELKLRFYIKENRFVSKR